MAVYFDYQEMLLGNLYLAGNILPENKSIHGKKIIQKINNTPIEEKETIVAFLAYQKIVDEVEVANLAVHPKSQNKGYGGILMKLVDKISGVNQIFLEVRVKNFSAKNLYLAHGYEVISRRADYYQNPVEDALIMVKKVRPILENEV